MAFFQISPFGEDRADLRAAMLAYWGVVPFSKKPPDPSIFLPRFDGEKEEPEQGMKTMLKNLTKKFRKK